METLKKFFNSVLSQNLKNDFNINLIDVWGWNEKNYSIQFKKNLCLVDDIQINQKEYRFLLKWFLKNCGDYRIPKVKSGWFEIQHLVNNEDINKLLGDIENEN